MCVFVFILKVFNSQSTWIFFFFFAECSGKCGVGLLNILIIDIPVYQVFQICYQNVKCLLGQILLITLFESEILFDVLAHLFFSTYNKNYINFIKRLVSNW